MCRVLDQGVTEDLAAPRPILAGNKQLTTSAGCRPRDRASGMCHAATIYDVVVRLNEAGGYYFPMAADLRREGVRATIDAQSEEPALASLP